MKCELAAIGREEKQKEMEAESEGREKERGDTLIIGPGAKVLMEKRPVS